MPLTEQSLKNLIEEYKDVKFLNAGMAQSQDETYVSAAVYLTGDLMKKLDHAQAAQKTMTAFGDNSLDVNVTALERVIEINKFLLHQASAQEIVEPKSADYSEDEGDFLMSRKENEDMTKNYRENAEQILNRLKQKQEERGGRPSNFRKGYEEFKEDFFGILEQEGYSLESDSSENVSYQEQENHSEEGVDKASKNTKQTPKENKNMNEVENQRENTEEMPRKENENMNEIEKQEGNAEVLEVLKELEGNYRITARVNPLQDQSKSVKAMASISIDGVVAIKDLKVVEGKNGYHFVGYPSSKSEDGSYRDVVEFSKDDNGKMTKEAAELKKAINDTLCYMYENGVREYEGSAKEPVMHEVKANITLPKGPKSNIKGSGSIQIGEMFKINSVTVKEKTEKEEDFIAMPSAPDTNPKSENKFSNIVYPITSDFASKIQEVGLTEYNEQVMKQAMEKGSMSEEEKQKENMEVLGELEGNYRITARVYPLQDQSKSVKAMASVGIDDVVAINNLTVVESKENTHFVGYPSFRSKDGNYSDVVEFLKDDNGKMTKEAAELKKAINDTLCYMYENGMREYEGSTKEPVIHEIEANIVLPRGPKSNLKGFGSIQIGEMFKVNSVTVREDTQRGGEFVMMPSAPNKTKDNGFSSIVHPVTSDVARKIQEVGLDKYNRQVGLETLMNKEEPKKSVEVDKVSENTKQTQKKKQEVL